MMVMLVLAAALQSDSKVSWQTDYKEAVSQAQALKRPLFIFAKRETCGNCQAMESRVLPSDSIQQILARKFVCVKVDADNPPAGALKVLQQVKGEVLPFIAYTTPSGRYIDGTSGFREEDTFKADLETTLSNKLLNEGPKEDPKDAPKAAPPPPKDPAPIPDDELEARFVSAKLQVAKEHIRNKKKTKAVEVLEDVLQSYPKSSFIPEAKRLLEEARNLGDAPKK